MSEIKTWQERCLERGIGSCEARDEELIELRAALADRDAKLAALEGQEPVAVVGNDYALYWQGSEPLSKLLERFDTVKVGSFLYAAAGAASNAWKEAILEVMTIYGMDAPTTDAPEKILKDLIELATRVAIDPTLAAGAAPAPEDWRSAVAMAYGHLWHINNEPMAPIPLRSEESASYAARKLLRDLLTTEERGEAINSVRAMLSSAPKEPT